MENPPEIKEALPEINSSIIKTGSFKGRYFGEEFIKTEFRGSDPITKGLLWERDTAILLAKEKSGKSIFGQFWALHLTVGHDLFGEYEISEPCNVIYLQAEGKIAQTQQNIKRMMKVVPGDMRRFLMLYYPAIQVNTEQGFNELHKQIKTWEPLKAKNTVFMMDSLYRMMKGSLKDDEASNAFIDNVRILSDEFGLTPLIMAHAHRDKLNPSNMEKIFEGDDAIFGSFVWKAFVDHVLLLQKHDKNLKLSCNTQRTGEVVNEVNFTLNEPDPLFFSIRENLRPSDDQVFLALKLAGRATRRELEFKTSLVRSAVHNSLQRLFIADKVDRQQQGKEFIWYVKP